MTSSERGSIHGGLLIAVATLVAGIGGYAITILAARFLQTDYVYFAAFWAFLYLAVGTFAGFQQEVSRGTLPLANDSAISFEGKKTGSNTWFLAIGVAAAAAGLVAISEFIFGPLAFGRLSSDLFLPLVIGVAANVIVGALSGIFYGISSWWPLAFIIIGDVAFRLIFLGIGFTNDFPLPALAWLVVAPYGLLILCLSLLFRRRLTTNSRLDVGYQRASLNIVKTVFASLGTSILVSGMPLLIAALSQGQNLNQTSAVIFSLILTRAPLVVGVLALQSFLVVYFRDHSTTSSRSFWRLSTVIIVSAFLVSLVAWIVGADIIVMLAGESFRLDPEFIALLTLTSLPTALLAVAGSFVLAKNLHTAYSFGWVVAGLAATILLLVPLDLNSRVMLSLGLGPLLGLAVMATIASKFRS